MRGLVIENFNFAKIWKINDPTSSLNLNNFSIELLNSFHQNMD